ncbi:MAG: LmeA family phospholipid-binding protein [Armatimonadota bacterium]
MKRFLIFLCVLGVGLLGLYVWWQRNATRIISEQVKQRVNEFFVNAQDINVENDPIKLIGWRNARVPKLTISGKDLQLKKGGTLASVKIVLKDIDVSGPPFHFTKIGNGSFQVTVTDKAVTEYVKNRDVRLAAVVKIPTNSVTVRFSKAQGTVLKGDIVLPIIGTRVPVVASGTLVPSSKGDQVDFRVKNVDISRLRGIGDKQVTEAFSILNPVVDISSWPVESEIDGVKTGDGVVVVHGKITGAQRSFLP